MSNMRSSGRYVVLAFMAALLAAVSDTYSSEGKTVGSPWEETGLNFDFINERVDTLSCQQSETAFLGCVGAMQALLERHGQDLQLIHASWQAYNSRPPLKAFGAARVLQEPGYTGTELSELLKQSRERRQRILSWQRLYRSRVGVPLDFTAIRQWMLTNIVEPEDLESYAAAAINGYLGGEDPHARIFPAALGESGFSRQSREYTGIGVMLRQLGNVVIAAQVMRNGPAFEAGLRNRDALLSVNGENLDSLALREVVDRLRGEKNTGVILGLRRSGREFKALVIRDNITIENVGHRLLTDRDRRWGYVRIETFADANVCRDFYAALGELEEDPVQGLILDLRDNLGGLVGEAVCVADLLLPRNRIILTTRSIKASQRGRVFRSKRPPATRLPVITLVNAGTGSAAEVLAGSLQDHGRSFLVGERTFGKASIQTMRPWDSEGKVVKLATVARYFLPSGRTIQMVGIQPDFEVHLHDASSDENQLVLREEDLFPHALPALGTQQAGRRPAAPGLLLACGDGYPAPRYQTFDEHESENAGDAQLDYSKRLLHCIKNFSSYRAGL